MSLLVNHSLIGGSYQGPPIIIQSTANRGLNSNQIDLSFAEVPSAGDLLLMFVSAGVATGEPTTVPSGFTLLTGYAHTLSNFVGYCYYKIAGASEPNYYLFSWVGAGSACGTCYQIRHHNGFGVVTGNFRNTVGTTLACGPVSGSFATNSLGIAFATCHNTTNAPYAFNSSYVDLLNATPLVPPTRGTASAHKVYSAAVSDNTTFSWINSRYALSIFISVLSSNP